jgi:hypothetical protein
VGVSQPLRLVVNPVIHADELARFESDIVRGPGTEDCAIWTGAIGGDGDPRFGCAAVGVSGSWCGATGTRWPQRGWAWHWNPGNAGCTGATTRVCVRVSMPGDVGLLHLVAGSQRDNMEMMGRAGRGWPDGDSARRSGRGGRASARGRAARGGQIRMGRGRGPGRVVGIVRTHTVVRRRASRRTGDRQADGRRRRGG